MRDDFVTQRTAISATFNNGVTSPPVNNNHFRPTSGRPAVNGEPFIVAAGGDGASGEVNAGKVSNLINSLNPNLFLYLGDVYEKGSPTEFYNWYGTTSTFFGRLRSITDPTIGNHEYENNVAPGYFDYWDNIPKYYSFDADGWHFISLNSNASIVSVAAGSAQYNWLQNDLSDLPANQCTIVYYHHPFFDIGPEGPTTAMSAIWSLMAQHGVDIVLNGHDHDYQRWVPLDGNGNPSPNGITEFVAGGAGHSMQTITGSDSRVAYSNSMNPGAFGVLLLQLNSKGANFSYQSINGSVLDSGVIPCVPVHSDSQAPTTPGGLSGDVPKLNQVDLTWTASTDNVGVAGYTIYRNGSAIKTLPAYQVAYSDTTVAASTTYSYSIAAFDPAGNHSPATTPISVTTDYTLTVTSAHGTVSRDDPGPYHHGDVVHLTAVPNAGWSFADWSGDATGTNNPVAITINSGKSVTAHYTQNVYTLTVTSAHGTVKRSSPGPYHYGDVVQLTAAPYVGWRFVRWIGDAAGASNPVPVTMNGNKTVTAIYKIITHTISGNAGAGGATLTYTGGTTIADAAGAYSFAVPYKWSGTVTASKAGYVILPRSRSYSNVVANRAGQNYTAHPLVTKTFQSVAAQDGGILESGENTNLGGSMNATAATFNLGDDASRKQSRAILSFNTSGLPDTVVVTHARLKLKRQFISGGGDPFIIFQGLLIDVRNGFFGTSAALQTSDFQAATSKSVGPFNSTPVGGLYTINLPSAAFPYINKAGTNGGLTQLRLRFKLGRQQQCHRQFH